jgi:hypothetical protein
MIFILIPILLLIAYVVGLIGVMHSRESGSKIIGLLYGIPVMLLSLILLIPSLEIINEPPSLKFWLWLLFAASPLILSWLAIWNGFRKRDAGAGWFAGIVIAESMLGAAMILYFWPAPIQILFILILHIFPSLGYPMA